MKFGCSAAHPEPVKPSRTAVIVTSSDGAIHVHSEPGSGTKFTVHLPSYTGQATPSSKKTNRASRSNGEHIVVVDDESHIADFYSRALKIMGYTVTSFTCPAEALSHFRNNSLEFDAVITDYNMPEMKGTVLAKKLRDTRPDIPIILTTGMLNENADETKRKAGLQAILLYLKKSVGTRQRPC